MAKLHNLTPFIQGEGSLNHKAALLTIQLLFGWVSTSGNLIRALAPS